jgi:hypothetical protein
MLKKKALRPQSGGSTLFKPATVLFKPTLINRVKAFGDLGQRQHQIKDLFGRNLKLRDVMDGQMRGT